MRLLRAELARFWSRRMVWVVTLVVMLCCVGAVAIAYTQTDSVGPSPESIAERNAAEKQLCIDSLSNDPNFLDSELASVPEEDRLELITTQYCDFQSYIEDKRFFAGEILWDGVKYEDPTAALSWSEIRPDTSQPRTGTEGSQTVRYSSDGLTGIVPGVAIFFLVVAVVIGASFMGAEFRFGTVENLLLWEPRRSRVLGTKYLAGFISSALLTALLLSFLSALLYGLANLHGVTDGLDSRFVLDLASTIGRAGLVGGLFFVLSMAVSVIARNTTAAVGVILGWFAISNVVIGVFLKAARPWELFTNAIAFITEGDVAKPVRLAGNPYDSFVYDHGYLMAGLVTAAWAFVLAGLAALAFARRDVD